MRFTSIISSLALASVAMGLPITNVSVTLIITIDPGILKGVFLEHCRW